MAELSLTLSLAEDLDDGVVRIDQADLHVLGLVSGSVVALAGRDRVCYARLQTAHMQDRNQGLVRAPRLLLRNLGLEEGQKVTLRPVIKPELATEITLNARDDIDALALKVRLSKLASKWRDRPLVEGDIVQLPMMDGPALEVKVACTSPRGPVLVASATRFVSTSPESDPMGVTLAGLRATYKNCYNLAVRRLRNHLGPVAKSILLVGPAGCGKTQMVKRLAEDTKTRLRIFDIHQLLDRQLKEQSIGLDDLLTDLPRKSSQIILLDNLEALDDHPARHVVVTQLATLLDELRLHQSVLLFGTCSGTPDPRLLSGQRFDIVLSVDAPDCLSRHEILLAATNTMILAPDCDLHHLATATHGYTASDLFRLANTARLSTLVDPMRLHDFQSAMRTITPLAQDQVYCDIPDAAWEDVGGQDDIKNLIYETLSWSLSHQDKFTEAHVTPPRSLLISGAKGAGKTLLVRAASTLMPIHYIEVNCPSLMTRDLQLATRFLHEAFALAHRKAPCLIFFDDLDALLSPVTTVNEEANTPPPVVAELLSEIDRLRRITGVIVMAATSRPDRLTSEMMSPGRFDYAVSLPLPDATTRKKILQIHASKLPLAGDVDLDLLADKTNGMTPADLVNLCNRVGLLALRQSLLEDNGAGLAVIDASLFEQVLRGRKN